MGGNNAKGILKYALLLFIEKIFADGHQFQQDHYPKHMCVSFFRVVT